MPQVLNWPGPIVEPCRAALLRGELVALPTEAGGVVAANGLRPDAVARLTGHPAIAVRGPADARDWLPDAGPLARRFMRRCWPGPVVLTFAEGVKAGVASRLPDGVVRTIGPGWELSLIAPRHPAVRELLERLSFPLVLGEGSEVEAAVVVSDPTLSAGERATIVEVRGGSWTVRRAGAVLADDLTRFAARTVLFVCTGNTCRSPLCEALCKRLLADRLGCGIDDLPARGFVVTSAGLGAMRGEPAAADAVAVAAELGADLSGHVSRPATPDLLMDADDVIGMTAGHLHGLAGFLPAGSPRLLCGDADLPDPIGGDRAVYQACAGTIWQGLQRLVGELVT
jgi:L-threonylcarbamoyladenylate synthase